MAVIMTVGSGVVAAVIGVVLRTFWREIFRWPLAVGIDFGRCFLMIFDDKPGQVRYAERSMAFNQVSTAGDHAHKWR